MGKTFRFNKDSYGDFRRFKQDKQKKMEKMARRQIEDNEYIFEYEKDKKE